MYESACLILDGKDLRLDVYRGNAAAYGALLFSKISGLTLLRILLDGAN